MSMPANSGSTHTSQMTNPQALRLIQAGWSLVAIFMTGCFIAGLVPEYFVFRDDPRWAVGFQDALRQTRISADFFAAYILTLDVLVVGSAVGLAVMVFRLRSHDRMALLVSITIIIYAVSLTLAFYLTSGFIGMIIRPLIPILIAWLMSIFPDGQSSLPRVRQLIGLLAVVTLIELVLVLAGRSNGIGISLIAYPLGVIGLVARYRDPKLSAIRHQQIKWLLWGFFAAFFAAAIYYLIPILFPTLGSLDADVPYYTVNSLLVFLITNTLRLSSSIIFVAAIGLSIVRYRLWDIDLTINRSLVAAIVTLVSLLLFFGAVLVLQVVVGETQPLIALILAIFGTALLYNPVRSRARHFVDRRLYGFAFDLDDLRKAQKQQKPEIKNPGALTGRLMGNYELLGVIGRGGMGEVYKGYDGQQTAAVKILPEELAHQEEFLKRFQRESDILATLNHPNIVRLFEAGVSDNIYYMAMELIEGSDLSDVLKARGKLELEDVRSLLEGFAAALDYAHSHHLVHRDIKPSNLMTRIRGDGENLDLVLMDFGVARMQEALTRLTGTGAVGTIDYMAPEQIMEAREVDHRADIYALGVVIYEILTGERPFKGNPGQVLFAHLQQPPPDPRDILPELPSQIAKAIMKALAKDAADRYQSARQFAAVILQD